MSLQRRRIQLSKILEALPSERRAIGETNRTVTHPAAINLAASSDAIVFVGATQKEPLRRIRDSRAGVIVCSQDLTISPDKFPDKTLILVNNPRLSFIRILHSFFVAPPYWEIHPTAVIDSDAIIHPNVYIGPYCVVGKSEIDEGTILHGYVCVYDNCIIGRNVVIYAGCVIGAEGFGFERDEKGILIKFPHFGRLIIEDNVEIQGLTNVDKGTLGDTVIGEGTKIDTGCHIGHNVHLGKHCVVAAHTMIGGGVMVEDHAYIAPCACFRNRIRVGARSMVGTGALVTKDIPEGVVVMGAPARPANEYKQILGEMKRMAMASDPIQA